MIISARETAMFLGVSVPTVTGYIKDGILTNVYPVNSLRKKKNVHIKIASEEIEEKFNKKFDVKILINSMGMMPITRASRYMGMSRNYFTENAEELGFNIKHVGNRIYVELKKNENKESTLTKKSKNRVGRLKIR